MNLDPSFREATQNYQRLFAKHATMFPILEAYRNKPADLNALSQARKSLAAAIGAQPLLDKRRDINTTMDNIASGKGRSTACPTSSGRPKVSRVRLRGH